MPQPHWASYNSRICVWLSCTDILYSSSGTLFSWLSFKVLHSCMHEEALIPSRGITLSRLLLPDNFLYQIIYDTLHFSQLLMVKLFLLLFFFDKPWLNFRGEEDLWNDELNFMVRVMCVLRERICDFHQILPKMHEEKGLRTTAVNDNELEDVYYVLFISVVLIATCICLVQTGCSPMLGEWNRVACLLLASHHL